MTTIVLQKVVSGYSTKAIKFYVRTCLRKSDLNVQYVIVLV